MKRKELKAKFFQSFAVKVVDATHVIVAVFYGKALPCLAVDVAVTEQGLVTFIRHPGDCPLDSVDGADRFDLFLVELAGQLVEASGIVGQIPEVTAVRHPCVVNSGTHLSGADRVDLIGERLDHVPELPVLEKVFLFLFVGHLSLPIPTGR